MSGDTSSLPDESLPPDKASVPTVALSAQQRQATRDAFDADGFVGFFPLFDRDAMATINRAVDHFIATIVPTMPAEQVYLEQPGDPATLKQIQQMHRYSAFFDALIHRSVVHSLAETLLGEPVVAKNMQYFNKPAGVGQATPPHQDGYYFHLDPPQAVTAWLALEDVDDENGCVHYVRGSHRDPGFRAHGQTGVLGFSQGIPDFGTDADRAATVAAPGTAGTLLIHHAKTIHFAGPNRSADRSRRALGFIYYASSARVDTDSHERYQRQLADRLASEGRL